MRSRIAIGSHESWPDRPFEQLSLPLQARLLGHGVTPDQREGRPVFRSLCSGDAVVALGVLGVVGAVGEADYRQPAHRFVLRSVALAGHRPPRVRGLAREHAVRRTLAAGALFLCVFGAGGAGLDHCSAPAGGGVATLDEVLRDERAVVFMAATPFHRAEALERLGRVLERRGAPSLEVREAIVALRDLRGDCAGAIDALMSQRQFRRALERGDSCDDPGGRTRAARAAFLAGELELASRYLGDDDVHDSEAAVRVHLLAGSHAQAARVARRLAAAQRASELRRESALSTRRRRVRSRELDCMADALEARAGSAASLARLQVAAQPPPHKGCIVRVAPNVECQLLLLDLRSPKERTVPRGILVAFGEWTTTALFLLIESDPGARPGSGLLLGSDLYEEARGRMDELSQFGLGLDRSALAVLMDMKVLPRWAEPIRPLLLARSALEESMLLRHDEARRLIALAARDVEAGGSGFPELAPLRALVELRAGDPAAASRARHASRPEWAMSRGWNHDGDILSLDGALRDLSNLALMAEAVGDRELAKELATGLRRIREASLRRDIAMPLAILERYPSPPAWE